MAVQSDESYSIFDHLFFPEVRSPTIAVASTGIPHIGLVIAGSDRLQLQRWLLVGYMQPKVGELNTKTHFGAGVGYLNNMLAPAIIIAQAGFLDWEDPIVMEGPPETILIEEHHTRDAALAIGYLWRGTLSATIGGVYTDDSVKRDVEPERRAYLGGPAITLDWVSSEATRYTGPRRALIGSLQAAIYPHEWSSFTGNIVDIGGTFGAVLPFPIGRRHTIHAFVRGRRLIAREDPGLLQVGGESPLAFLYRRRSTSSEPPQFDVGRFPPNLRFVEPLRGYEDYAITTDRVTIGELSWRYPIIIDRGIAALWLLPAHYIRQIDLELFGTGAIDKTGTAHYAIGAATTARIQFMRIPLAITYQIARRLVDDKALTQFVGLGADI